MAADCRNQPWSREVCSRFSNSEETPRADPHAGCCGEGRLEAGPYPIGLLPLTVHTHGETELRQDDQRRSERARLLYPSALAGS